MKITVLGAGVVGSAVACDLVSRPDVTHVQVCDAKAGTLGALADRLRSPKLRTIRVDVRDERALAPVLSGSAVVVSCTRSELNPKLAALALAADAHFCDLGGDDATVAEVLALAPEAAEAGRWVVPNCGLAPGLVNVLVVHGLAQFEAAEAVTMRVGNIPVEAEGPLFHRLAYPAERLVEHYVTPALVIRDGEVQPVEPLTGLEEVSFEEPFTRLEAFYTAGKLSSLPHDLAGRVRTLDYKTLRHPGHAAAMRAVLGLGFAENRSLDVRTHLTYRDVLVRRLRDRLGGAFRDAVLVRIRIEGVADGAPKALTSELIVHHDEQTGFSAMQRCTAFPTAAVACFLGRGAVPGGGAAPPECVLPTAHFLEDLAERGIEVSATWAEREAIEV